MRTTVSRMAGFVRLTRSCAAGTTQIRSPLAPWLEREPARACACGTRADRQKRNNLRVSVNAVVQFADTSSARDDSPVIAIKTITSIIHAKDHLCLGFVA